MIRHTFLVTVALYGMTADMATAEVTAEQAFDACVAIDESRNAIIGPLYFVGETVLLTENDPGFSLSATDIEIQTAVTIYEVNGAPEMERRLIEVLQSTSNGTHIAYGAILPDQMDLVVATRNGDHVTCERFIMPMLPP